jgi:hypothetical protein
MREGLIVYADMSHVPEKPLLHLPDKKPNERRSHPDSCGNGGSRAAMAKIFSHNHASSPGI